MKIRIISRLSILMETVEMLYKYVNNLSLDNIKRDFLLKYGEQLSAEDRAYYDTLFHSLDSIIKEGTRDLDRNDSRLQYYFRDLQPEGCREWVCMAKVILYSFYDGKEFSFDESIQECRQQYQDFAADNFSHYKLIGIDRARLNYVPVAGDEPVSLFRQLQSFDIPGNCKWEIYKAMVEYEELLRELEVLIRPIANRMETILGRYDALLQQTVHYWQGYFAGHSFQDFKTSMMGVETDEPEGAGGERVVWFWWMGCSQIHFYQNEDQESLNIGILVRAGITPKLAGYVQENVINILKFLSDKSKFEIIHRLSGHQYYGLELANEMQLTSGTISKHLNTLYSYGLLNLQRVNNRVYYQTDEAAIRRFLVQLEQGLLGYQPRSTD